MYLLLCLFRSKMLRCLFCCKILVNFKKFSVNSKIQAKNVKCFTKQTMRNTPPPPLHSRKTLSLYSLSLQENVGHQLESLLISPPLLAAALISTDLWQSGFSAACHCFNVADLVSWKLPLLMISFLILFYYFFPILGFLGGGSQWHWFWCCWRGGSLVVLMVRHGVGFARLLGFFAHLFFFFFFLADLDSWLCFWLKEFENFSLGWWEFWV